MRLSRSCEFTRASGSTLEKTEVWNRAGVRPEACNISERIARQDDPTAVVWKGSDIPTPEQGLKILGTPLRKQQVLLDRIPLVSDVQSAWLLLLHCASARANFQLRAVRPSAVENFARTHDGVYHKCCRSTQPSATPQCERHQHCHCLWVGLAQCTPHKGRGILGQLVRLFANDPSPSPNRGSRIGPSIGRCPSIADVA